MLGRKFNQICEAELVQRSLQYTMVNFWLKKLKHEFTAGGALVKQWLRKFPRASKITGSIKSAGNVSRDRVRETVMSPTH